MEKHTKIGRTMLKLVIKGDFELVLSGYHRIENSAKRNVLLKKEYHCDQKAEIIVDIPSNKDTLVAFERSSNTLDLERSAPFTSK